MCALLLGVPPDLFHVLDTERFVEERSIRVAAGLVGVANRTMRGVRRDERLRPALQDIRLPSSPLLRKMNLNPFGCQLNGRRNMFVAVHTRWNIGSIFFGPDKSNLGIRISRINRVRFSPAFASLVFLGALGTCCFPAVAGPVNVAADATAPDLGATSTFGVVSSTFTNTDAATIVNGDVCFTTGPGTSFTLNGTQTVPCSAMVGLDQASALADLNGQACTSLGAGVVNLDTVVVGNNLPGTIPPGCYSSGGSLNISTSATVTLSGGGVYIFRSTGALGIGANSQVILADGACPSDVFWAPVAATTLGASATLVGNIFDAAGITFGHLAVLSGRALAYGGTITADANTISVPSPFNVPPDPDTIFANGFERCSL